MSKIERQKELLDYYQFKCTCTACVQNYPTSKDLPKHDKNFKMPNLTFFGSVKETLAELGRNFAYFGKNVNHHPSLETCVLIHRNSCLFMHLAGKAYCSFYGV